MLCSQEALPHINSGNLWGCSPDAVPYLVELLRDPNEDVRKMATNALERIAPEALERRAGE